jgi:Uma2 family endonuclease
MMGAMGATTTLMTFEEFERLPDEAGKCELLEGEVVRMPPAKRKDMMAAERLYLLLRRAVGNLRRRQPELGLGEVHMEMGYRMGSAPQSWLQPDVSITHADQSGDDYYEGAPLVAIEVASESQSAAHLEAKAQMYLSHGAREVWLIYPKTQHVWICRAGKPTVEQQETAIRSDVLPGVEITIDDIFGLV